MVCVKAHESKIRQADFKKLIANASAAYVIYQKIDGQIVPIAATNALAEMMLGAGSTADDYLKVVGTPVAFGQVDEVDRPRFIDKVNEFCQNGGVLDVVYRRKLFGSDTCHVVHARGQIKHLDDGTEYAVIYFEDVNARKENTYTSTVTELPDMSYLLTFGGVEVRRILAQGGTPALAYFDIKGMKAFNAAFGFEEGDELLKQVGRGLQKCYSGCTVCRVSDDRFTVIGDLDEIRAKLAKGEAAQLVSKLGENIATTLKCGYAPIEDEGDVAAACDRARTACESIRDNAQLRFVSYSTEMDREDMLARYVRQSLDDALDKGWVQPFFQPIVRTLTGETCGFEALARWDDPVFGPIPPSVFVPALEKAQLIQKLDGYIVKRVCEEAMEWFGQGKPCAPISVNLSRLDFLKEDVFEEIERVVRACDIPRDYLNIEITESVMQYGPEVKTAVERFHQAGYQVWMDDFGSGYSSLNVLKGTDFNEIKLDMGFLSDFSEKSRILIRAVVRALKRLGVSTLAEGVETERQVEFLKSIGCEKLQGFYFSKPLSRGSAAEWLDSHAETIERRSWRKLWNTVGKVDVVSERPNALLSMDAQGTIEPLFVNQPYRDELESIGLVSFESSLAKANQQGSLLSNALRSAAAKAERARGEWVVTVLPEEPNLVRLGSRLIARNEGTRVFQVVLENMTRCDDMLDHRMRIDMRMREFSQFCSFIGVFHLDADSLEVISRNGSFASDEEEFEHGLAQYVQRYAAQMVYPDDREAYLAFADSNTVAKRLASAPGGMISETFRTYDPNTGAFEWKTHRLLMLSRSNGTQVMDVVHDRPAFPKEILCRNTPQHEAVAFGENVLTFHDVWASTMRETSLCMFWKDTEHRFVAVSKAFLDYWGMSSEAEVLGKTDEDMGWHIDEVPFRQDELDVIKYGKHIKDAPGKCIIKGVVHSIIANEIPVYDVNGKIVGLMGYFVDAERATACERSLRAALFVDSVTSAMNVRGSVITALEYAENYRYHDQRYAVLLLDVPEYARIVASYGPVFGGRLLKAIADRVRAILKESGALGRVAGGQFVVFKKGLTPTALQDLARRLEEAVNDIHEVQGKPCTLHALCAVALGSEADTPMELYALAQGRLTDLVERPSEVDMHAKDLLMFDRRKFDSMSSVVYMADVDDYSLVYLNERGREDCGLSRDSSLLGRKCYEVLQGRSAPCEFCTNARLSDDAFLEWEYHNPLAGGTYLLRDTLVPWHGKLYRFEIANEVKALYATGGESSRLLRNEKFVNDAVSIALLERNPGVGIEKLIEKVGRGLEADHVYILEQDDAGHIDNSYEWHREGLPSIDVWVNEVPSGALAEWSGVFEANAALSYSGGVSEVELPVSLKRRLRDLDIASAIVAPLKRDGELVGVFGLDLSRATDVRPAESILLMLSHFVESLLRNRDAVDTLQALSIRDPLTNAFNRRGLASFFRNLDKGKKRVFVYCDIDWLKRTNDNDGHSAGDEIIKSTAEVLGSCFDFNSVFRVGGDEFLVVSDMPSAENADLAVKRLRADLDRHGLDVSLGYVWSGEGDYSYMEMLAIADSRMYEDKQRRHALRF